MLYPRHLKHLIEVACLDTPVVLVNGARQTGKTTLARQVLGEEAEGTYLTLDDATTLIVRDSFAIADAAVRFLRIRVTAQ